MRKGAEPVAETFTETSGSIARQAAADVGTVRLYADEGLIECMRLGNGQRLFKPSAVAQVREILRERIARRGRYARTAA